MSRRQSRTNAIVAALKSMFGGQVALNGAVRCGRNIRQNRSQCCAVQSEVCESRVLLSAYVPNHVLLGLDSAIATPEQLQTGIGSVIEGSQMKPLGNYGTFLVTLPAGVDALDAIESLRNYPGIKYLEPNWTMQLSATPNDPNYNRMWAMENTGQLVNGVSGIPDADIDANLAWDIATGSLGVLVAVIDSGIDYRHPDLAANMWTNPGEIAGNGVDDDSNGYIDDINGYDFIDGDPDPSDGFGHGTHVAGTIGAVGNNGIGTVGVNWDVSLMALKIFTDGGFGTSAAAIEALNYAVAMGAPVSNNSYGGTFRSLAFENAIINAQSKNHIFVAAAGNSSNNNDLVPFYPASFPQDNVIAVAATEQSDQLAGFSHFGVVSVDIGAPGVNIWSTTPTGGSVLYGPSYDFSDGTSMASPAVAGAVALLKSLAPAAPYTLITQALYVGSDKIASMNGIVSSGGRLNVSNSLRELSVASVSISRRSVREDAGAGQATLTITKRAFPANQQLDLNLFFDDPTEVNIPSLAGGSAFSIPAGQLQITIPIDILDDTLLDGTQIVTFDVHYAGASIGLVTLNVTDVEALTISVDPASIREDAGPGAGTVTVTRENTDTLPPNILAVVNNELLEYDTLGNLVSTQSIPWPGPTSPVRPVGQDAHDLVMLQNGRIAVYNGTTIGYISVFNPVNTTWQHFFINGLSTSADDPATGGITSSGNYVFVSDMESTPGNPFGVVRLDLTTGATTRFATKSPGYRLFVENISDNNILEVNPATGATMNTIPMPVTNSNNTGFNNGVAFDGTNLWVLAGPIGNDQVFQLNPDTGAILEIHHLGGSNEWDGLGWVNGLLYAQDSFTQNKITVYDPAQRRVIKTLDVGRLNGIDISGGLSGITGPNALIATSRFDDTIYEINPLTGVVTREWRSGLEAEYGIGTANGEIYVGAYEDGRLSVFNRTGLPLRTVDVNMTLPEGVVAIGGDDVKGITTTPYRYRDLYVGLNDKLYVLDVAGTAVGRYDLATTTLESFFDVAKPINAVATASDGTLWGAGQDGTLYHFSSIGTELGSLVTGVAELIDIDLNITGQILLTSRDGTVLSTNTSMAVPTAFSTGFLPAFVTLGRYQKLPAGDMIVTLTNSDPTEVSIPLQVIIRAGQNSVTVPLGAVDDNILDGTQTVTITASALGYIDVPSDSIDVTDAETIGVDIIANQISEAAGINATQARVFRTNVDGPFPYISRQVASNTTSQTILDYDKTTSLITIPSQTSRLSDVNVTLSLKHSWLADLDIYLISPAGTRVELVTDLSNNGSFLTNTTFDDAALGSILVGTSPFTGKFRPEGSLLDLNGENPSGVWTLEITDDNEHDFGTLFAWSLDIETRGLAAQLVTLSLTGDPGEISVQRTVTIPANQAEIFVPVNAIDDTLLDGTQIAGIQAAAIALGYEFGNDNVNVLDQETLTFSVSRTRVSEAAGPGALTGTLTRSNTDISLPFTVSVSSSDTSELTVPVNVTIPANETSVTFPIDAIDDAIVDADQTVLITVSAPAYGADITRTVIVEDLEPSLKLTTGTPVVAENSGTFDVTVARLDLADLSAAMIVNLTSGPGLTVPATVTILAGLDNVTFTVGIIDNAILDGDRISNIHATGSLVTAGDLGITITDYETVTITVDKSSVLENAGVKAAIGTVRRSNTGNLERALVIALASSDETELKVPATVTIPAGQVSATFFIDAVNDPDLDGTQNVTITAISAGYVNGTVGVEVLDHEPPVITGPTATTPSSKPRITWNALSGALRYDVWISNLSTGVAQIVRNTMVPTNSFVPPENLGIGRYRVWVRAIDILERPGVWSLGRNFFINTPGTITSPASNVVIAGSTFPTIVWSAIPDATKYELWVNNLTTGKTLVINRTGSAALSTTSYVSTEGLGSGTYRIWARGLNSSGEAGLWSLPTTHTVLAPPVIIQPIGGGTFDTTPTFNWTAVTGATNYDVYVANAKTNVVVLRNKFVTTSFLTATTDIASGEYRLWVRAQSGNSFSNWSIPSTFSIGLPPKITSVKTVGDPAKPQFSWTTISGTERYELWVTNTGTNVRVIHQTNLTNTTFTSATTLPAGTYRVWVRAVSTMGEITAWSVPVDLVIASAKLPQDSLDLVKTAVLASSTLDEGRPTPESSPLELPDAFVLKSDAPVNAGGIQDPAVPMAGVLESTIPVEPVPQTVSENDAVMSEWQSAEWWAETSEIPGRKGLHSAAVLAASIGFVVRNGQSPDERRKRNS